VQRTRPDPNHAGPGRIGSRRLQTLSGDYENWEQAKRVIKAILTRMAEEGE